MLANIYLHEYDREMEGRGVPAVRYVDDFVVLAKSQRAAKRLLETSRRFLEGKLKLHLNTQKSKMVSVLAIKHFQFLGFVYGKNKSEIYIRAHRKFLAKGKRGSKS